MVGAKSPQLLYGLVDLLIGRTPLRKLRVRP